MKDYPQISKALRDMYYRKHRKSAKKHPEHLCTLAFVYGTGHPDLDQLQRERCPLIFEIELLNVELPGKYKMDSWAMSDGDKASAIPKLKEEGNKLYEEGDIPKASEAYFEALCYLEEQMIKERRGSDAWQRVIDKKVPCY